MGVLGVPWHPQILADQLTLSQPGGTDYAHLTTTGTPGFSDLPTALVIATTDAFKLHSPEKILLLTQAQASQQAGDGNLLTCNNFTGGKSQGCGE